MFSTPLPLRNTIVTGSAVSWRVSIVISLTFPPDAQRLVMSDSLQPHGQSPTRLLCPWNFSRQEYWSGLLFPPPGALLYLGTEPLSLMSPALAGGFFTTSATWEAHHLTVFRF